MAGKIMLLFLFSHLLGDYYLRRPAVALKKEGGLLGLLLHSIIYAAVTFAVTIPFWSAPLGVFAGAIALSHFIIDLCGTLPPGPRKKGQAPGWRERRPGSVYAAVQALHIAAIAAAAAIYSGMGFALEVRGLAIWMGNALPFDYAPVFKWVIALLLAAAPVNVTFTKLFSHFKPIQIEVEQYKKAGAMIGSLERALIIVLLSAGQYAAMGFVITAKSVARYSKINEDKAFGEYYLLGTLFSVLSAVIIYLAVW